MYLLLELEKWSSEIAVLSRFPGYMPQCISLGYADLTVQTECIRYFPITEVYIRTPEYYSIVCVPTMAPHNAFLFGTVHKIYLRSVK